MKTSKSGDSDSVRRSWLKRRVAESGNSLRTFINGVVGAGIPTRYSRGAVRQKQDAHEKVVSETQRELSEMNRRKLKDIVDGKMKKHLMGEHDQLDHGRKGFSFARTAKDAIQRSVMVMNRPDYSKWGRGLLKAIDSGGLPELAEAWASGKKEFQSQLGVHVNWPDFNAISKLAQDTLRRANELVSPNDAEGALGNTFEGNVKDHGSELDGAYLVDAGSFLDKLDTFLIQSGHPAGIIRSLDDLRGLPEEITKGIQYKDNVSGPRDIEFKLKSPVFMADDIDYESLSQSIGNELLKYYRQNSDDIPDEFLSVVIPEGGQF